MKRRAMRRPEEEVALGSTRLRVLQVAGGAALIAGAALLHEVRPV